MKKIFAILMACVALCGVASAITPAEAYLVVHNGLSETKEGSRLEYIRNVPYETFKQYAFAVVDMAASNVATNKDTRVQFSKTIFDVLLGVAPLDTPRTFVWMCGERLNEKDLDVVDTRFSEMFKNKQGLYVGDTARFFDEYPYFPKTCEVLFEEYNVNQFDRAISRSRPRHGEDPSLDYLAAKVNRIVGQKSEKFGELKSSLRSFVIKAARMRLRSRSEGFVVRRDGSNPLQEVFDRAAACVNAPHQRGLKEFIEEYAPGFRWIDVEYPSDMDVMVLVGDILNGKKAIDGNRGVLFFCLGADQYNEFVDRYNGRH